MRNPFAEDPQQSWRRWGERDPYYAVLLDPRHRRAVLDQAALAALYDSGERYVAWLEAEFDRIAPDRPRRSALDFGCGVGRITLALARRYQDVVGVDIAPGMLREAQREASARGIANVRFVEPLPDHRCDAICAYSVLQHMGQAQAETALRQLAGLLAPGGVGIAHILVADRRSALRRFYSAIERRFGLVRWPLNLLRSRPLLDPAVQMNVHSLARLSALLHSQGLRTQVVDALGSAVGFVGVEILFHRPA
jgi:ubiquinone/menaquinone biosynthesis C-methylase UbiE